MTSRKEYLRDLQSVLNKHGVDATLDMPDFILAQLLDDFLHALRAAKVSVREWEGGTPIKALGKDVV